MCNKTPCTTEGKGRPSPFTEQRGDLYLTIEVLPHPFFRFDGDDIVFEIPIRPDEAILGTKIKVPTPDGSVTMTIPAGVRSGQSLRLRSKKWSLPKSGRSEQIVKLQIVSPEAPGPIERDHHEKNRANSSFEPRADLDEVRLSTTTCTRPDGLPFHISTAVCGSERNRRIDCRPTNYQTAL